MNHRQKRLAKMRRLLRDEQKRRHRFKQIGTPLGLDEKQYYSIYLGRWRRAGKRIW